MKNIYLNVFFNLFNNNNIIVYSLIIYRVYIILQALFSWIL